MSRLPPMLLACALSPLLTGSGCERASPETAASMYPSVEKHLGVTATLGLEIYRRDKLMWWAGQVIDATLAADQSAAIEGWIIDVEQPESDVLYLTRSEGQLRVAHVVHCIGEGSERCSLETPMTPLELSEPNRAQYEASMLARHHPSFAQSSEYYDTVVLPVSDGPEPEWWVYLIALDPNPNLLVLGRHYRFVVDASGASVRSSRAFSEGALQIDLSADTPPGARPAGISIEHTLDAVPTEMHVWTALQYELELVVVTESEPGSQDPPLLWSVDRTGQIKPF